MTLYLAGPFGFSESGRHWVKVVLKPHFQSLDVAIVDPFGLVDPSAASTLVSLKPGEGRLRAWRDFNSAIGGRNVEAIEAADGVFAILDGPDVDSGTASEIGFAFGRRKRIWGYRSDFRLSSDNEGSIVNLQVEYFILRSGGVIFRALDEINASALGLEDRI